MRGSTLTDGTLKALGGFVVAFVVACGLWACASPDGRSPVGVPSMSTSAMLQIRALDELKQSKTAAQSKIDSRLYMALLHERQDPRLDVLPDFRFIGPGDDGKVAVDILAS